MHPFVKAAASVILYCILIYVFRHLRRLRSGRRLPPGPSALPFIGNVLQLPKNEEWITYRSWGKKYGEIYTLRAPGTLLMVINSRKVINDLFERRSAIYSDRPHLVMVDDIVGWDDSVVMGHYGEHFRANRRMMKMGLGPGVVKTYLPLLEDSCVIYLGEMLRNPAQFKEHFRNTAGSIGLQIAYGKEVSGDEGLISLSHEAMKVFNAAAMPGLWLVDSLTILKHVPSWFPFAEFKRYGQYGRKVTQELLHRPYNDLKQRVKSGTAGPSFTSMLLRDAMKVDPETEHLIRWSATSILAGNSDTSTAALSYFVLAMVLYPDVQVKAQAEIDKIIGSERLPTVDDRASLPYVEAIMKEVLRWHPVVPMVSHAVIQDDMYNGYTIPAGTALIGNVWAACHDPSEYKDPESFRPERYFAPESAPESFPLAFGFGRRVCPGMHVAQAHIFLTIASTLAVFNISRAVDESGNDIIPEDIAMSGVVSFPKEFECSIRPRSEAAAELIRRSLINVEA